MESICRKLIGSVCIQQLWTDVSNSGIAFKDLEQERNRTRVSDRVWIETENEAAGGKAERTIVAARKSNVPLRADEANPRELLRNHVRRTIMRLIVDHECFTRTSRACCMD